MQHYQRKVFICTHFPSRTDHSAPYPTAKQMQSGSCLCSCRSSSQLLNFLFIHTQYLTLKSNPCTKITTVFASMITVIQDINLTTTRLSPNLVTRLSFLFCQGKLISSVKLYMAKK